MAEERNPRRGRSPRGPGERAPEWDASGSAQAAPESWVGRSSGGERPPADGEDAGRGAAGHAPSDERIRADVCDRLTEHGGIDATEIRVAVAEGSVTLEGTVGARAEKLMAEEVADKVVGVREVLNRIRLRGRGGRDSGREDARQ